MTPDDAGQYDAHVWAWRQKEPLPIIEHILKDETENTVVAEEASEELRKIYRALTTREGRGALKTYWPERTLLRYERLLAEGLTRQQALGRIAEAEGRTKSAVEVMLSQARKRRRSRTAGPMKERF